MKGSVFKTKHCGYLVVSEYHNRDNVEVIFVATGYKTRTSKDVLLNSPEPRIRDPLGRSVFGVGCIGIGPHAAHGKGGADTKAYSIWRAMLRRCYYAPERKAWRDAVVCPEWHNFQTFATWYAENYPRDGAAYQLDKDVKLPGNKVYGPEACSFVTQAENLRARRWRSREGSSGGI